MKHFVIVMVLIGGIGLTLLVGSTRPVQAAIERVTQVFVTNWPANQAVTITNNDPLPVLAEPKATKIIRVFDNTELLLNGPMVVSDFVDIDGYKKVVLYAHQNNGMPSNISATFSVDGINIFEQGGTFAAPHLDTFNKRVLTANDIIGPKLKIFLGGGGPNGDGSTSTNITVDLYLIP